MRNLSSWWESKRLESRIIELALERLLTQARANWELDRRGSSERDEIRGGRADRYGWLFSRRRSRWLARRDPLDVPTWEGRR